jgi:hypothetical protein
LIIGSRAIMVNGCSQCSYIVDGCFEQNHTEYDVFVFKIYSVWLFFKVSGDVQSGVENALILQRLFVAC